MRVRRSVIEGWLMLGLIYATAPFASAAAPSLLQQDRVEAALAPNFVRPETAIWRFDDLRSYSGSKSVVCGSVNYESSAHKYQGFHQFYAIVDDAGVILAQVGDVTQDLSGRLEEKLRLLCGKN